MAYSFKGSISFGLVYIPVALVPAAKKKDVKFHLLDRNTGSRIKYQKTCVNCGGKEVRPEDIVKGYEYEKNRYVLFEEKDFETLKTKKDKTIAISSFTALDEIDPVFYDKSYFVLPTGGERAFALLLAAMKEQRKVGIAKTVLGTNETLIAIREHEGKMLLSTLYFADEIAANPAKSVRLDPTEKELELARGIVANMTEPFAPEVFRDEYRERVLAAIDEKIAGKEVTAPKEARSAKVSDLLEALTRSLRESEKTPDAPKKPRTVPKKAASGTKKARA